MKFLKKLSRKAPEEKVAEELQNMEFNQGSIFFPDMFPKVSHDIILKVVNQFLEKGKIEGKFIGSKGWFLFNCSDGLVTITQTNPSTDSRMEMILPTATWEYVEKRLAACIWQ